MCAVRSGLGEPKGAVHLEYTPEQQRLRTELGAYFARLVPDTAYARCEDPAAQAGAALEA